MNRLDRLLQHRALIVFMLGHFTVDMFGGLMVILYALMKTEFSLSNQQVGFVALAYTGAGSLSQPLFGWLADRYGSRWFAVGSMAWSASMVGLAGWSPSYGALLAFAMLAGLGSGAYHPQGASNAAAASGDMRRNTAMSVYTVGGTSGYALGPVLGAIVFGLFGQRGTLALAPFGFVIAFLMWKQIQALGLGLAQHHARQAGERRAIPWGLLAPVIGVAMLRSWVELSAISFIPVWFDDQGYRSEFYSVLTMLVIGVGAVGTIVGGILADRVGQRAVLGWSLVVAAPLLVLFGLFPGPQSLLIGPLMAFCAQMGLSVTLVVAQRLLPGRVGVASGFVLGLGFVTGGIGVPVTGAIADAIGTGNALALLSVLLLAGALLAARIPAAAMHAGRPVVLAPDPEPAA